MRALTPFAGLVIMWAAISTNAAACDVGPFPDLPAKLNADVIVIGQVDALTEVRDPSPKPSGTVAAEISVERVPVGNFPAKSYVLKYPISAPMDCIYSEGPQLRKGERVALYFVFVSGELRVNDWFLAEEATASDVRLSKNSKPLDR